MTATTPAFHAAPIFGRRRRTRPDDPRWVRPALLALLATTAVLYLWGLSASGWANSFYAAAVQAGSEDWKAFFFGSSDAANFITVDKPPASLWVMALSARIFGVNAWSLLVPQALEGVAAVALLYATVRRTSSAAAGLIAGAALALTPVATLMFRFNNPDALLTLTLVAAAYCTLRAVESASTRWIALAGAAIGLGFLTKMLQAFLIVPVLALVYLVAAPTPVRRRIVQLLAAGAALIVSAGWWVAIVELWPAASRPYIGGSQNNSVLELVLGYNGLGRLTGEQTGSVGGAPAGGNGGRWGETGWTRMFDAEIGGQIAWLVPAALLFAAVLLWRTRGLTRAATLLWTGWLLVTGLIFSFMQGIFHAYYTVALAPAVAALVGIGVASVWKWRSALWARAVLAVALGSTAGWAYVLLGRSADWLPWLRTAVLVAGLAGAVALLVRLPRRLGSVVAGAALVVALAAPAAYSVQTAGSAHVGAIVTAGPQVAGGNGPRLFRRPPGASLPGGGAPGAGPDSAGRNGADPDGARPDGAGPDGAGSNGVPDDAAPSGGPLRTGVGPGGALGGLLRGSTPSADLIALLKRDASRYTWAAAAVGSNAASGYQLATGEPVMAIGGFNGSDPAPTLAQFQEFVRDGKIHYFIGGGRMGSPNGGSDSSARIAEWVAANYTSTTVGGATVYNLTP